MSKIEVVSCPKCKEEFSNPLEVYVGSTGIKTIPMLGICCPKCGYSVELALVNALPLPVSIGLALMEALGEWARVSFMIEKTPDFCTKSMLDDIISKKTTIKPLSEILGCEIPDSVKSIYDAIEAQND